MLKVFVIKFQFRMVDNNFIHIFIVDKIYFFAVGVLSIIINVSRKAGNEHPN